MLFSLVQENSVCVVETQLPPTKKRRKSNTCDRKKRGEFNISQCASMYLLTPEKQKWVFMEYTIFNDSHPEFTDSIFTPQNVDFCVGRSQCASMYPITRAKQKWTFAPNYITLYAD